MRRQEPSFHFPPIDATKLLTGLYQGSVPVQGSTLSDRGVDAVVLSAVECQPPSDRFPGVDVIRARLDDGASPITRQEWGQALSAASRAANLTSSPP